MLRLRRKAAESVFIWPLLVLVGTMIFGPTLIALFRSFYDWNPGYDSPFVGFRNYLDIFQSETVHEIGKNTLFYLIGVPFWAGVPLVIALLLYERVPLVGLWRTIFFFPFLLSPVILGIIFRTLLRPDGILNSTLESIGLGALAQDWIDDPSLVKPVIIVAILWWTLGFGVLFYSAALSTVSPELFEAAEIDGATWLQRLRYVVIPSILPIFLLNTVFSFATVFLMFGYIYVLTAGGPGFSSATFDYDIYQNAGAYGDFGLAAAESMLLLLCMMVIVAAGVVVGRRYYAG